MAAIGFSLNNLTLFGLVLAIGIVVDDAIVVVEAVEHHIEHGLSPREASVKAMEQVSGPVVAIGLVLAAVFIPCAFITGIIGQFFRQFALTIAVSTVISAFNSLTLSPALSAILLQAAREGAFEPLPWFTFVPMGAWVGHKIGIHYGKALVADLQSFTGETSMLATSVPLQNALVFWLPIVLGAVAALLIGLIAGQAGQSAAWAGCSVCSIAASTGRTDRLHAHGFGAAVRQRRGGGGVRRAAGADVVGFHQHADRVHSAAGQGLSAGQRAAARRRRGVADQGSGAADRGDRPENAGRQAHRRHLRAVDPAGRQCVQLRRPVSDARRLRGPPDAGAVRRRASPNRCKRRLQKEVPEAIINIFGAPPVEGLGTAGGFKIIIQDTGDNGLAALQKAADHAVADGERGPAASQGLFTSFRADTPWLELVIDRAQAKDRGVSIDDVRTTLESNLGSYYINDFNRFGRTWQVNVQALRRVPPIGRGHQAAQGAQQPGRAWCRWRISRR